MEQQPVGERDDGEPWRLRGDHAAEKALAEPQEPRREARVVVDTAGEALGQPSKEREGSERDDERRQVPPRDEPAVQRAARRAHRERTARRSRRRPAGIAPERAPRHRGQSEQRAGRQVDAAGDHDRRQRDRQQPRLDAKPHDLGGILRRREIRRDRRKEQDFGEQDPAERQLLAADVRHATALRPRDSARSDSSAARMIAPCNACSQ